MIVSDKIFQIEAILDCDNSFSFLCTNFHAIKFNKFANSIEIRKSSEVSLVNLSDLKCKRSYEKKFLNGKIQIIADNLDMLPIYEKL